MSNIFIKLHRIISIAFLYLLLASCQYNLESVIKKNETISNDEIKEQLKSAFSHQEKGEKKQALKIFLDIYKKYPESSLADNALFYAGEIYFFAEKYSTSLAKFQLLRERYPKSEFIELATFYVGVSYLKLKDFRNSLTVFQEYLNKIQDQDKKKEALLYIAEDYIGLNLPLKAIKIYTELSDNEKIRYVVDNLLSLEEVDKVSKDNSLGYASNYAKFKIAEGFFKKGDFNQLNIVLNELLKLPKNDEIYQLAQSLKDKYSKKLDVVKTSVGCILPLSGEAKIYGEKILRGLKIALDDYKKKALSNKEEDILEINLIIKDSKGVPEEAEKGVEELVNKDKVILIIGPLLSMTSEKAALKAQELEVPLITLTKKEGITEVGEYIFRYFLTNSLQIDKLVSYSINFRKINKFAILYPDDLYGNELAEIFKATVEKYGGEVTVSEFYKPQETDFSKEIKKLARRRANFSAIFLPDYFDKISLIVPQLVFYDIKVQLLGTNGWNNPKLVELAKNYIEGAIFVDGFFLESRRSEVKNFVENFRRTYLEPPTLLEAYAYDTMNFVITLLKEKNINTREDIKNRIFDIKNFLGVTGFTSFTNSGDIENNLFLLTVKGNKIVEISNR